MTGKYRKVQGIPKMRVTAIKQEVINIYQLILISFTVPY